MGVAVVITNTSGIFDSGRMSMPQNTVTKPRNVTVVVVVALLVISIPVTSVVVGCVDVSHGSPLYCFLASFGWDTTNNTMKKSQDAVWTIGCFCTSETLFDRFISSIDDLLPEVSEVSTTTTTTSEKVTLS
jgi:hypothetical protein